jgi:oligopeptide transport system substrate-binding protein
MSQKTGISAPQFLPQGIEPIKSTHHSLDRLTNEMKVLIVQDRLDKIRGKFPHIFDILIFKELDRIGANLESDFINQRSPEHLTRLAYSIYFIRKNLLKNIAIFPLQDWYDVRFLPFTLQFTFGSKSVLGILAHAYLKDKYEAFDEDRLLSIIRKSISEAQLVTGSIYAVQGPKNNLKTLYFEISKKSGLLFSKEEIKQLKGLLKQEMQFCVEKLIPRVFMTRNEEELLRSILTLSREIQQKSDLPQVMILFDQQGAQEVMFTVILVRVHFEGQPTVLESLAKVQNDYSYLPERYQFVRYLRKKHPVEANVFRVVIKKDSSLLRGDLSLNFYLARQKVSQALSKAVGEFRDFNGGIILKQREGLTSLIEAFPKISFQNPDLLENFFYSLSPIEAQATLPIASLKIFFELFLQALNTTLTKLSDFFLKFETHNDQFFVLVRSSDSHLKEILDNFFSSFKLTQGDIITSVQHVQNTFFLGYLILTAQEEIIHQLTKALVQALQDWKRKVESQQILKLGLEPTAISLDPRIGGDQISSIILKMLFEGLMRENKEGKIDYGLAKSVDVSSDLKTYLFRLRSTRWSDGSLVSAFDFEYAWKKTLSPDFKTPFAYLFYPIKNAKLAKAREVSSDAIGIKALDELTLKVELESPTPYFLDLTAHTIYSPIHRLIDQLHPNWSFEEEGGYVCNGAFQLTKNNRNEGYELIKNQLYWDAANITLDQAVFVKANRYQSYEMFQSNNNHWIGEPLGTWDSNFIPQGEDETVDFTSSTVYWYVFNTQQFPFNNKKIRQALAIAFDRSKLESILQLAPAVTPIPPQHRQVQHSLLSFYNVERAQALFREGLKETGLSSEDFPIIPLIHLTGPIRNRVAEFIKHQWQIALGVKCKIEPVEWNILFSKMTEGNFQIGMMGWQPWINDPMYTFHAFKNGKELINFSKWEDEKYQRILDLAGKEASLKLKEAHYLQAEELLLEEMPVIPIFFIAPHALKKKNLCIPHVSPLMNFKWAHFLPSF